jgi:hypothetical protein
MVGTVLLSDMLETLAVTLHSHSRDQVIRIAYCHVANWLWKCQVLLVLVRYVPYHRPYAICCSSYGQFMKCITHYVKSAVHEFLRFDQLSVSSRLYSLAL